MDRGNLRFVHTGGATLYVLEGDAGFDERNVVRFSATATTKELFDGSLDVQWSIRKLDEQSAGKRSFLQRPCSSHPWRDGDSETELLYWTIGRDAK
jgi:hypothetical protein